MRYANRQDDNQHAIDAALRRIGAIVMPMHPEAGFDRLVAYRGQLFVIEVKDGDKPPSHQALTENETFRQAQLASVGVTYHVVKSPDEAIEVVTQVAPGA